MNTHDKYELPTLPEPFTYTRPGKSEGALFHVGQMQEYVLADRKLHDRMLAHEWIRPSLGLDEDAPYRFDFYAQEIEKLKAELKKFGRNDNDKGNENDHRKRRGSIVNNTSTSSEPVALGGQPFRVQPAEPSKSEPVAKVRNRGFEVVDGKHVPTVLVEFPVDDWESRDGFAAAVAAPHPLSESDIPTEPVSRDVEALVRLLEDGEWAEHVARTPLGQRLELAITTLAGEASKPYNEPVNTLSDAEIREVFLANGFTIKPGHDDLKPYVYDAARALLARYDQPAEPSRSEPEVSTTQVLITLGKVIAGYRPGEEGWSEYDQQAYDAAMTAPPTTVSTFGS